MLAKIANDDDGFLIPRGILGVFASLLAPTGRGRIAIYFKLIGTPATSRRNTP